MISPVVSFGSTYKVVSKASQFPDILKRHYGLEDLCNENNVPVQTTDYMSKSSGYSMTTTVTAPDAYDNLIETYMQSNGIKFKKYQTKELMDPKSIEKRIKSPEANMRIAKVNYDKLIQLAQTQSGNIPYCQNLYKKNDQIKEQNNFELRSADDITATTLYITPLSNVDDTVSYIKRFGAENLNPNSLFLDFSQRTSGFDHCMFFSMANAGMKEIPVYVDKNSFKIGKELGLLK